MSFAGASRCVAPSRALSSYGSALSAHLFGFLCSSSLPATSTARTRATGSGSGGSGPTLLTRCSSRALLSSTVASAGRSSGSSAGRTCGTACEERSATGGETRTCFRTFSGSGVETRPKDSGSSRGGASCVHSRPVRGTTTCYAVRYGPCTSIGATGRRGAPNGWCNGAGHATPPRNAYGSSTGGTSSGSCTSGSWARTRGTGACLASTRSRPGSTRSRGPRATSKGANSCCGGGANGAGRAGISSTARGSGLGSCVVLSALTSGGAGVGGTRLRSAS